MITITWFAEILSGATLLLSGVAIGSICGFVSSDRWSRGVRRDQLQGRSPTPHRCLCDDCNEIRRRIRKDGR